ncbi:MAG: extracellular solute-binding protein, partial [bacterium]
MTKKIIASVLALVLVLGLAACSGGGENSGTTTPSGTTGTETAQPAETTEVEINGITYHKASDMTTDNITLTYMHFDQDETVKYLADRFMQIYPNIKVVTQYENVRTYGDTLLTLVSSGKSPDLIMYSDADFALSNMLLMDISQYWNADE